jgi:hypothetical protein
MWYKISKNKTNPYTMFTIAIFFAVYISSFLYYYCFCADPAVYGQQQSEGNVNDISKRPAVAAKTTSQEPEPQIVVPSISTKELNNTIDMQSSGVDDKNVEELFEAKPEDNTETGSENEDSEKMDKQGTKDVEKVNNKQEDRNQQQKQSSDESASTGSIVEEEEEAAPEEELIPTPAPTPELEEEEEEPVVEEEEEATVIEEGEGEEEDDEPKDKPSDDTPLELPFP